MKQLFYLSLGLLLIFSACRKDDIDTTTTTTPPVPDVLVETDIDGIVTDEAGNPLENVTVIAGNKTSFTDSRGYFHVSGLQNQDHTLIRAEKSGYFTAFPVITTQKQARQSVNISLKERNLTGTFSASSGGQITTPSGSAIDFEANGVADTNGNPYNGSVQVYAYFIDPTRSDLNQVMPGNLTAIDAEDNLRGLSSFGMMNVELESGSGEPLQLTKDATLRMAIPADLQATAPADMPLWYFDEGDGYWKEEGIATRQGNEYVGTVSHFTFWNCDVPFELIELTGTVKIDGTATEDVTVRITRNTTNTFRYTRTNSQGIFSGKVPKDESLLIEIIDECGTVLYSEQIGPFPEDTNTGTIDVANNSAFISLTGTILDCNMDPVSNGYTYIRTDNGLHTTAATNSNGEISAFFNVCDATELTVIAIDLDNELEGDPVTFAISDDIDAGTLAACGNQFAEALDIQANGFNYTINDCKAVLIDSGSVSLNLITVTDDQGNGNKVIYDIDIIDWNNNPMDPNWGVSIRKQVFGNPDPDLQLTLQNTELIQYSETPGEFLVFEFNDSTIKNVTTGEEYTGLISLSARIQ